MLAGLSGRGNRCASFAIVDLLGLRLHKDCGLLLEILISSLTTCWRAFFYFPSEIVQKLHASAVAIRNFLLDPPPAAPPSATDSTRPPDTELTAAAALLGAARVRFTCGDSFAKAHQPDWQQAAVLYAPSSCFDVEMMQAVAAGCEGLCAGAIVITTTQRLPPRRGCRRPIPARQESLPYAKGRLTFYCYVAGAGGKTMACGSSGDRCSDGNEQRRRKRKMKPSKRAKGGMETNKKQRQPHTS